jgi:hypothetical protein
MRYGFTGSQQPPSPAQVAWMYKMMDKAVAETLRVVHHGSCIGSDYEMHVAAIDNNVPIVCHPSTIRKKVDRRCLDVPHWRTENPLAQIQIRPPADPLVRNRVIVDETDILLATPHRPERVRSGTWSTIRYALKLGRRVLICHPDGSVDER